MRNESQRASGQQVISIIDVDQFIKKKPMAHASHSQQIDTREALHVIREHKPPQQLNLFWRLAGSLYLRYLQWKYRDTRPPVIRVIAP